jgi:hypothetical protein
MEKATRLYTKEIRSCSGLLITSIHEHVVLSVLIHEHHEHYAWQGLVPRSRRAAWRQVTAVTRRPAISAVTKSYC